MNAGSRQYEEYYSACTYNEQWCTIYVWPLPSYFQILMSRSLTH